jgi:hypothetical protein
MGHFLQFFAPLLLPILVAAVLIGIAWDFGPPSDPLAIANNVAAVTLALWLALWSLD